MAAQMVTTQPAAARQPSLDKTYVFNWNNQTLAKT